LQRSVQLKYQGKTRNPLSRRFTGRNLHSREHALTRAWLLPALLLFTACRTTAAVESVATPAVEAAACGAKDQPCCNDSKRGARCSSAQLRCDRYEMCRTFGGVGDVCARHLPCQGQACCFYPKPGVGEGVCVEHMADCGGLTCNGSCRCWAGSCGPGKTCLTIHSSAGPLNAGAGAGRDSYRCVEPEEARQPPGGMCNRVSSTAEAVTWMCAGE
jgi:hypothetical protein